MRWSKKLNCFYSISANRRKQKDWFLWKNTHQSMSRNWENSSSMLQLTQKYFNSIELNKSFTVWDKIFGSKRTSVLQSCQFFAELTDCLRVHLQFQAWGYSSIWGLSKAPKSVQIAPDLCRHQICLQCFSFDCCSSSDFLCVRRMRIDWVGFCSEKT